MVWPQPSIELIVDMMLAEIVPTIVQPENSNASDSPDSNGDEGTGTNDGSTSDTTREAVASRWLFERLAPLSRSYLPGGQEPADVEPLGEDILAQLRQQQQQQQQQPNQEQHQMSDEDQKSSSSPVQQLSSEAASTSESESESET